MNGRVLAIDPGDTESGWCIVDTDRRPLWFGKDPNNDVLDIVAGKHEGFDPFADRISIEMIASYGMPVGREVFETCVWIGRFYQTLAVTSPQRVDLVVRRLVKLHHCNSSKAKDSNIRQALVDRFAPGQPNHGKGTKADPGWFYGFHSDIWQAYALAVYAVDTEAGYQP